MFLFLLFHLWSILQKYSYFLLIQYFFGLNIRIITIAITYVLIFLHVCQYHLIAVKYEITFYAKIWKECVYFGQLSSLVVIIFLKINFEG